MSGVWLNGRLGLAQGKRKGKEKNWEKEAARLSFGPRVGLDFAHFFHFASFFLLHCLVESSLIWS